MPYKDKEYAYERQKELLKDPERRARKNATGRKYANTDHGRKMSRESAFKRRRTVKGFLTALYRNMYNRVNGINKGRPHLYVGKDIITVDEFYDFAFSSAKFYQLFGVYKESGFERKLAPSVDRVDSSKGYTLDNMEWVTMSENSRRGAVSRHAKASNNPGRPS